MEVRKCDGSFEDFSPEKVKHGICEAYTAVNETCPDGLIESLVKNLFIYDKISSKEIGTQITLLIRFINLCITIQEATTLIFSFT